MFFFFKVKNITFFLKIIFKQESFICLSVCMQALLVLLFVAGVFTMEANDTLTAQDSFVCR